MQKKGKFSKKILALLLCLSLVLSYLPGAVFAEEGQPAAQIGDVKYDTLNDALAAVQNNETITLSAGTFEDASVGTIANLSGKTFTIKGEGADKTTVVIGSTTGEGEGVSDYRFGGATVTFDNLKIQTKARNVNYCSFAHAKKLNFNNCTFYGRISGWGEEAIFDNCTFDSADLYEYVLWTWGSDLTIKNSTFNTLGKAIKLYGDSSELTIENCTFISTGTGKNKPAIAIANNDKDGGNYTVTIDDQTTQTGFVKGEVGTELWGSDTKSDFDVKKTLIVNGVQIYPEVKAVAKIGDVEYTDLAAALTACKVHEKVELLCDVDLKNEPWTPIDFKGSFDGCNHKISNLKIDLPEQDNVGFFSQWKDQEGAGKTIKNITFENVDVKGRSNVGAVIGTNSEGSIDNLTVCGTIKVEGATSVVARAFTGVVVGAWAYKNYTNITVDGGNQSTSYVKGGGTDGRYVGGIIGHADGAVYYENCTVKNISIGIDNPKSWLCGGIAGPGPADSVCKNSTIENVTIGGTHSGGLFGWYYDNSGAYDDKGVIDGALIKNVSFAKATSTGAVGGNSLDPNVVVKNVTIENVEKESYAMKYAASVTNGDDTYLFVTAQKAVDQTESGQINILKTLSTDTTLKPGITLYENGQYIDEAKIFAPEGYKVQITGEYPYTVYSVVLKTYVAQIGEDKYETLPAAFEAAIPGDTVKLLDNIALAEDLTVAKKTDDKVNKNIILDLVGKTITCTDAAISVAKTGALTVKDSVGNGSIAAIQVEGGMLTVKSGQVNRITGSEQANVFVEGGNIAENVNVSSGNIVSVTGGTIEKGFTLSNCANASVTGGTFNGNVSGEERKYIRGGKFTAGLNAQYIAEGYELKDGEVVKSKPHTHSYGIWQSDNDSTHIRECSCGEKEIAAHSFGKPSFLWSFYADGSVRVMYSSTCAVCGHRIIEIVGDLTYDDTHPDYTYWTASVEIGGRTYSETKQVEKSYTVTINGCSATFTYDGNPGTSGAKEVPYGATVIVTPTNEGAYDYVKNGVPAAFNATTLTLRVTENVTINLSEHTTPVTQPSITLTTEERTEVSGKYKVPFKISWAISNESKCKFVEAGYYYRYGGTDGASITDDEVKAKGSVKKTSLTSLNGSYKCTHSYSSSYATRNIYAIGYLVYKDVNGQQHTIYTEKICNNYIQ